MTPALVFASQTFNLTPDEIHAFCAWIERIRPDADLTDAETVAALLETWITWEGPLTAPAS